MTLRHWWGCPLAPEPEARRLASAGNVVALPSTQWRCAWLTKPERM